jgi:hypothetical protein
MLVIEILMRLFSAHTARLANDIEKNVDDHFEKI